MIRNIGSVFFIISLLLAITPDRSMALSENSSIHTKSKIPTGSQVKNVSETGLTIYQKYCLTCHQKDGSGVPSTYPSLIKSSWVMGDKTRLIRILLNGLEGEITVDEDIYNGIMPKQDQLTDNQIATVLTFLRQNFENKSSVITPKDVKLLRHKLH